MAVNPIHSTHCRPSPVVLLNDLDLSGPPYLVEKRFQRAVKPQDREPAFARHSLAPVRLFALGHLRTEVEIDRTIGVRDETVSLVVLAGEWS